MYRAQSDMSRHKGPANGMAGRREHVAAMHISNTIPGCASSLAAEREGALIFMYRAQPDMSRHKGPANGMAGRREHVAAMHVSNTIPDAQVHLQQRGRGLFLCIGRSPT